MGREVPENELIRRNITRENLPELLYQIYFTFSLPIQLNIQRCSGDIIRGKFSERLKLPGNFFCGREGVPTGEIFHGKVFSGSNSSWRNFSQEIFSMWKFFAGEILHQRIFRGRNFPFGGWDFNEKFPVEGVFRHDLKKIKN